MVGILAWSDLWHSAKLVASTMPSYFKLEDKIVTVFDIPLLISTLTFLMHITSKRYTEHRVCMTTWIFCLVNLHDSNNLKFQIGLPVLTSMITAKWEKGRPNKIPTWYMVVLVQWLPMWTRGISLVLLQ